jgi:hypothetical protein
LRKQLPEGKAKEAAKIQLKEEVFKAAELVEAFEKTNERGKSNKETAMENEAIEDGIKEIEMVEIRRPGMYFGSGITKEFGLGVL